MTQSVLSPQHPVGTAGGPPHPFPGSRGARQALTPTRAEESRVSLPRTGLALFPLLFDGHDTTGWRFWYATPSGTRSSARPELSPARGTERGPGDAPLPTCADRPRRGGCVPPWFTVHGPRDWLA